MTSHSRDIKFYDTQKLFELNPDMKIKTIMLEDTFPIVIIDNFYKNPDPIRDLCFNTPISLTTQHFDTGFTGRRGNLMFFNDNKTYYKDITKIILDGLKLKSFIQTELANDREFLFNVYDENENTTNASRVCLPHSDTGIAAGICYLNKEEEGELMGTGFYKHKESGISGIPNSELQLDWYCTQNGYDQKWYYEHVNKWRPVIWNPEDFTSSVVKGNKDWEMIGQSTGSYNQQIFYVGVMLHSALIDYDKLKKSSYKRLNQMLFLHAPRHLGGRPELSYHETGCSCGYYELRSDDRATLSAQSTAKQTSRFCNGKLNAFETLPQY